ncbi:MAG: class I SAM-dependent rRNA methyltransferase [Hydrogenothermaceae bacterium]|nr:class I SAM-dependent rRNA methyltransferase [Hydrogenothermaceae bacterium]
MKKLVLNSAGIEKIKSKNLWVYNREIKRVPSGVKVGELVRLYSGSGEFLGIGYINPRSKITVRVLSFQEVQIDREFIRERIERALKLREDIRKKSDAFRIVHSEADMLPGLVADYYSGYLSIQINTAGMENLRSEILASLVELLDPKGIVEKSDRHSREVEGLTSEESVIYGDIPKEIRITENGLRFSVNLLQGQKTGFYLDQRANREKVSWYVKPEFRVLDLFSNTGGFGVYAFSKGATFVKFVDISESAVSLIERNLKLNSYKEYEIVKRDVFNFLKQELRTDNRYDMIVIDPPAFAKSKNEREGAIRGFKYLILNSLKLLNPEGYMAVFSCSHHISHQDLLDTLYEALRDTSFIVRYIDTLHQDLDHPYLVNIPTSFYLKGFLVQKLG